MQEHVARDANSRAIPFDAAKLDRLMEAVGLDALIATSKHNVQYLLGAERAIFFDYMDAMGVSRYLPVLVYPKGAPEKAAYVGHRLETHQRAVAPLWVSQVRTESSGSVDAVTRAVALMREAGVPSRRVGVEMAFLPMDAGKALADALPGAELKDALLALERLRAVKSPAELAKLKLASEFVIASMLEVIAQHGPGTTKQQLSDALRVAEVNRGLTFEYCLLACGKSHNRAPSAQRWETGDVLSLDSGGNYHGYIGDLARMAVLGEPDSELKDLLAEIEAVQRAAFAAVRAGALGGHLCRGRGAAGPDQPARLYRVPRPWHGPRQPRGPSPDRQGSGSLRRHGRAPAAGSRHGRLDRDHDEAPQARLHQARGHGRCDADRL
jgi:Xaa-Pro aminopeptidase